MPLRISKIMKFPFWELLLASRPSKSFAVVITWLVEQASSRVMTQHGLLSVGLLSGNPATEPREEEDSENPFNESCQPYFCLEVQVIWHRLMQVSPPENTLLMEFCQSQGFFKNSKIQKFWFKKYIFENFQNDEISLLGASPGLQAFKIIRCRHHMTRRAGMLSFLALE